MSVWRKRFEHGDKELRKGKNRKLNKETDFEAWDILYKDFTSRIPYDDTFESYLKNLVERIRLIGEYILTKKIVNGVEISDRFMLNRIKMIEAEIKEFEKVGSAETITIPQMLNRLSKMQGFKLSDKETTVLEYFELIKDYKKWVKE